MGNLGIEVFIEGRHEDTLSAKEKCLGQILHSPQKESAPLTC
jgi:hypothetical protein